MKEDVDVLGYPVPNNDDSPYGLCGRKATLNGLCGRKATLNDLCRRKATLYGLSGRKATLNGLCGRKATLNGVCGRKAALNGLCGRKATLNGLSARKATLNGLCRRKATLNGLCGRKATLNDLHIHNLFTCLKLSRRMGAVMFGLRWLTEFCGVVLSCFTLSRASISVSDASLTKPEDSLNPLLEAVIYFVSWVRKLANNEHTSRMLTLRNDNYQTCTRQLYSDGRI